VKDIYEVLRQKEVDRARVQSEIDALRVVIPLVEGERQPAPHPPAPEQDDSPAPEADATGTEGPAFSSLAGGGSGFWKRRR
jgi:hypothetical protein